jgi:hypothetical protein
MMLSVVRVPLYKMDGQLSAEKKAKEKIPLYQHHHHDIILPPTFATK